MVGAIANLGKLKNLSSSISFSSRRPTSGDDSKKSSGIKFVFQFFLRCCSQFKSKFPIFGMMSTDYKASDVFSDALAGSIKKLSI